MTLVVLVLLLTSSFKRADAELHRYQLGVGLFSFDYAEFRDDNTFLDGEKGLIPGILMSSWHQYPKAGRYLEWDIGAYYSLVHYDGETWDGIPAKTRSDAFIIDATIRNGIYLDNKQQHSLYAGLGFHYWLRNIRPGYDINGDPVAGLLEHYSWLNGLVGYKADLYQGDNTDWGVDIRLTYMLVGRMDIDFLGFKNYDNTFVTLGSRPGFRVAFPVRIKNRHDPYTLTPYYESFRIGRSNDVRVTANGVPTSTVVHEPRSITQNIGIEIHWNWD